MSIDKLKERGWYLTEAGLKKLTENKNNVLDEQGVTKLALDTDFREIAGGALNSLLKQDALQGNAVLQLVKVRNCSAPKSNEESKAAPRLLRIHLTDGQTQCQAVEMENIQALSLNLPPGTKILLKNGPIKCSHALLQLRASNVEVLGGHVVALVEKWEVNRSLAMFSKGNRPNLGSSGPPRWIPFGKPIPQLTGKTDETFNSMAEAQTKMIAEENHSSEFDSQRNDAISEAIKTENKKVFGGGTKQLQDANVQKIMDKGYTEEQAKTALRYNKNNVELALNNLRKREERTRSYSERDNESQTKQIPARGNANERPDRKKPGMDKEKPETTSKPSQKISLFDFVEDKLPETSEPTSSANTSKPQNNNYSNARRDPYSEGGKRGGNRFENNISASFANRNNQYGGQQQQQNNYYNNSGARNDRANNQSDTRGGYNRRDYNENRNSGPQSRSNTYPGPREKRYDNRDSYNSHPQQQQGSQNQGNYNNRYQKDYNNQAQQQSQTQYSQKDYRNNDYNKGGHGGEQRNDRNYNASGAHDNQKGGYQRGGYNNSGRGNDFRENKNDQRAQGNNYGGNSEYQGTKSHHQTQNQQQTAQKSSYNEYSRQTNAPQGGNSQAGQGRQQQTSNYANKDHHQQRRSPPGQQQNTAPKPNNNQKQSYTKQNANQNMNHVIDATANLKIGSSSGPVTSSSQNTSSSNQTKVPPHQSVAVAGHPQQSQNPPNQQQQQQPTMNKNYVAIPNGTYNPYQIMGFQNKATNEFAMNVLKTQQLPVTANAQAPPVAPPTAVAVPVVPLTSVQPPAQMPPGQFVQQPYGHPPPPVIPSPQPMANQFLPPGTTVAFPAVQVGMMPQVKFNVGEVCVAKYWEDERFYPAVITDVTEKTNVVRFVDYGNFEEVLKHDCLPLNTAPPGTTFSAAPAAFKAVPVSAATQIIHPHPAMPPQQMQQHQQQAPSQQNMRGGHKNIPQGNSGGNAGGNKSYREQRGVYVPPQKRM
ncbi:tudor domain-containing protein 3 [Culicoides brevitarsis]|uniref:tudor domain-containing protein 3 n=1 Tax=Culicoides brevitarsis TaxID=469753 RepID=UPI00307CAC24